MDNDNTLIKDKILNLLNQVAINKYNNRKIRDYLGASYLGENCSRKIQYQYTNIQKDAEPSAESLRILERGIIFEKVVADYLNNAGFELKTEDSTGNQIGFGTIDKKLQGHIDGIIYKAPISDLILPAIWENKALSAKAWRVINTHGLLQARPIYAAQIWLYQAYTLITAPALFTALNVDTMEIYIEFIEFNIEEAQRLSDKAVKILEAVEHNELMPRCTNNSDYFECKWCQYKKRCWELQ